MARGMIAGLLLALLIGLGMMPRDTSQTYAQSVLTWNTGVLSQARGNLSATAVGSKIMFAGGIAAGDAGSNVVDIYESTTGAWSVAALSQARSAMAATTVGNKALFAGGAAIGGVRSNVVDIYDSTTGTWSTATLSQARYFAAAAAVGGKALFAGGDIGGGGRSNVVDIYDSATGTWNTATLSQARYSVAAAAVGDKALFAGGDIGGGGRSSVVDIYDSTTGTWSTATLSQARDFLSATAVGGKAMFAGGRADGDAGSNVVDIYDSATGTWSTATLSKARWYLAATSTESHALFAGGVSGGGPSNVVDVYDSTMGTWSTATLAQARYRLAAAAVGRVALFAGGFTGAESNVVDIATEETPTDTIGPIVTEASTSPNPAAINVGAMLTAAVSDSTTGGSTIASAGYSIDGGSSIPMNATDSAFDQVSENVTESLAAFTAAGLHTVCVRGADSAGNVGDSQCIILVVYDPTGGFVTGGGAVNSPAGSDLVNTSAAGPATFGFVSKYLPGKSTPDGNLEFQFKAGNLSFKSTAMDWLVVTGESRAMFRGSGTVNGATVCTFEVDAWDGSFSSSNLDGIGLKIFSCASGGDRYSLSASPLKQGSIIIHK